MMPGKNTFFLIKEPQPVIRSLVVYKTSNISHQEPLRVNFQLNFEDKEIEYFN